MPDVKAVSAGLSKAGRLLLAGRVTVRSADLDGRLTADVLGDTALWSVHRTAGGRFACSCPAWAYGKRCAHIEAVMLIAHDGSDYTSICQ